MTHWSIHICYPRSVGVRKSSTLFTYTTTLSLGPELSKDDLQALQPTLSQTHLSHLSAQVHLMHSQYVRAFWTLFAFSWSFIYPHDISNLYVLIFQVSFLNKYCKFFIHSWLSFAFVFIRFFLSEDVAPHDILQLQLPFNFSSPCQKQSNYLMIYSIKRIIDLNTRYMQTRCFWGVKPLTQINQTCSSLNFYQQ